MCVWRDRYRWTWVNGPAFQICVVSIAIVTACAFPQPDVVCGGQVCKEQQICAARQAVCIDPGSCGDGVIDPGEVCDDGNVTDGDGCSADCHSDETCGNGIIDLHAHNPEECDDGRLNGTLLDTCDATCQAVNPLCGNGAVDQDHGEQCDPGAMDSTDCNSPQGRHVGLQGAAMRRRLCQHGGRREVRLWRNGHRAVQWADLYATKLR